MGELCALVTVEMPPALLLFGTFPSYCKCVNHLHRKVLSSVHYNFLFLCRECLARNVGSVTGHQGQIYHHFAHGLGRCCQCIISYSSYTYNTKLLHSKLLIVIEGQICITPPSKYPCGNRRIILSIIFILYHLRYSLSWDAEGYAKIAAELQPLDCNRATVKRSAEQDWAVIIYHCNHKSLSHLSLSPPPLSE